MPTSQPIPPWRVHRAGLNSPLLGQAGLLQNPIRQSPRRRRRPSLLGIALLLLPLVNLGVSVAMGIVIYQLSRQMNPAQAGAATNAPTEPTNWANPHSGSLDEVQPGLELEAIASHSLLDSTDPPSPLPGIGRIVNLPNDALFPKDAESQAEVQSSGSSGNAPISFPPLPINRPILADGNRPQALTARKFTPPALGYPITSGFGYRQHPVLNRRQFHQGLDLGTPVGTPIRAAAVGKIKFAGWRGTYGKLVVIEHDNGYETRYAHLHEIQVKAGDWVNQGDIVGLAGGTGRVTGPHLHFEILADGVAKDPMIYLK